MAAPVWVLSVNLETKSAAFTTGMADAAKAARGSFDDIKSGANEASQDVGYSMTEARHGVMMLGEEFGIHLPRGLTTFIASLGPVGAAMEAAFPFLAIVLGATLLIEHLVKIHEEAEKLTEAQGKFETATQNAFNALDMKMLEAEKRADELRGDHLGALKKELEIIDRQSMGDLVHQFDILAKAADAVFAELKSHWYTFGIGATGASHALTQFKGSYDLLLAQGKDKEASDLLKGTRESAEKTLQAMRDLQAARESGGTTNYQAAGGQQSKQQEAMNTLLAAGVGLTDKEVAAQQTLVEALAAQVTSEGKIADLKKAQTAVAVADEHKKSGHDADKVMRAQAEAFKREEEEEQKLWEEHYHAALNALEESEREKIAATEQGTQARLDAISAGLKKEQAYGLQDTGFYRSLMTQKVEVARQMTDEQNKLTAEAGKEAADLGQKMAMLQLEADKQAAALRRSSHRANLQEEMADEIKATNQEYQIKMLAYQQEIAALDKHGKDYENKLKAIQDKETELTRQHENQITQIKEKAEEERNSKILSAEQRFNDSIATGLTQVVMGHETAAKMISQFGDQLVSGLIKNAIMSMLTDDMSKERDAAKAARTAWNSAPNPIIGAVLAATTFAAVMAFNEGGVVPGVGNGDTVPAMLTPGEGVVPGSTMDKLDNMARSGNLDGGSGNGEVHYHAHFAPHVQAIDAAGVDKMLTKHADKFHRHFAEHVRRQNK